MTRSRFGDDQQLEGGTDDRVPSRMERALDRALQDATAASQRPASLLRPSGGIAEDVLDWDGFAARRFPQAHRHDLQALVAYEAYRREHRRGSATALGEPAAVSAWESDGGRFGASAAGP